MPEIHDARENQVSVGEIPFRVTSLAEATRTVIRLTQDETATSVRLANAFCVATASTNAEYGELLKSPGINFPDGTPVVWFMRAGSRSASRPGRVRGPSLFTEVLDAGREADIKHFFLGTTAHTLDKLSSKAAVRFPGIKVAGAYAPPYGPLNAQFYESATEAIVSAQADIVWVALGSPKQDFATAELARRCGKPCIGVGAAFDFVAGTTQEAPIWMQNTGTEWLFRLVSEPKRLWRRYLIGNLQFAYVATRGAVRHKLGIR